MRVNSFTYIVDKRSEFYFGNLDINRLSFDDELDVSFIKKVCLIISFCFILFKNFRFLLIHKLYNFLKLFSYYKSLSILNRKKFILVYHSLNPYLHFALFLTNAEKIFLVIPFFLLERHKKVKYFHPKAHALVQGNLDERFVLNNWQIKSTIIGGFFLSNLYSDSDKAKIFDTGFISQITEEILLHKPNSKKWSKHLEDVAENSVHAVEATIMVSQGPYAVLLRHESSSALSRYELEFFTKIFRGKSVSNFSFLYPDNGASYKNINKCNVLVSVNSNLAIEALSVGKKVIFYQQFELGSYFSLLGHHTRGITVYNLNQFVDLFEKMKSVNDYGSTNREDNLSDIIVYNRKYTETLSNILYEKCI